VASGTPNPLVFSGGESTRPIDLDLDNDGLAEQTEKLEVTIEGVTNAIEGSDGRSLVAINDDDDPRDLTVVDADDNTSKTENGTATPETFTVELDPDGNGETAATSPPFTSVEFSVDEGASDVNVGTDFSDPTVDVRIVDENGSGGDAFQERLSSTRGRINFASGARSAELKLAVNPDNIDDADTEDIVVTLANPVSAVLSQDPGNTDLAFTIEDDDSPPTVQFAQPSSSGPEGTDGQVEVTLSSVSGRTVVVDYTVDTGNSTATEGSTEDFTTQPPGDTLRFPSGTTSRALTVATNDDAEDELDEKVALDLEGNGTAASRPTRGGTRNSPTSHVFTIRDNDAPAIGTNGPGGVGTVNGEGRLALWLRADELALSDGDPVGAWPDASGRSNDASASGAERPTYRPSQRNGRPTLKFDGSGTRMTGSVTRGFEATYFAVGNNQAGDRRAFSEVHEAGNDSRRNVLFLRDGGQFNYYDGTSNQTGGSITSGRYVIFGALHQGQTIDGYDNGAPIPGLNPTSGTSNGPVDSYVIGDDRTSDDHLDGNLAEFVVFGTTLGDARRILVENYLSAKYDINLKTGSGATDVYAGDQSENGDYDRGVFGIGREAADDRHTAGATDGLRFDAAAGLDDGDYLMAGHRTPDNQVTTQDIGAPVKQRMQRVWYVTRTDPGNDLTSDVTFDLSKAGLSDLAGQAANYVLLEESPAGSGAFSTKRNGADRTTDDRITFNDVDLSSGEGITLGTTNQDASPLSGTALTVIGTAGNEGNATTGELGGDAGWRLVGPPVTGATAGDLISGSDANGSVVEFSLPEGAMFYKWDDTAGSGGDWSALTDPSAGFRNGRGYLLFLFDDEGSPDADPLNPSITLDVATGTVPTNDVSVTGLNTDAQFHVLANPFNEPFDLTSLEQGGTGLGTGSADFSATVQIWDGGATTAEDKAQPGSYVDVSINTTANSGPARMAPDGDVVSAWQGLVVERTNTGSETATQLTFDKAGRTDGTRSIVGSKANARTAEPPYVHVGLKMTVTDDRGVQVARDEAASLYFHPNATKGWDAFDASKLEPLASRYAVIGPVGRVRGDSTAMKAVESQPVDTASITIPVQLRTEGAVSGTARIATDGWTGVPKSWTVTLIDTKGTVRTEDDEHTEITPQDSYTFALSPPETKDAKASTASAAGTMSPTSQSTGMRAPDVPVQVRALKSKQSAGPVADTVETNSAVHAQTRAQASTGPTPPRFKVRIETDEAALPVELVDFQATHDDQQVTLNWKTASETNNSGFYVEHQTLSMQDSTATPGAWSTLGFVEGRGTSQQAQTYQHTTEPLDYGRHVFRLRQVDTDGTVNYSKTVEVEATLDKAYDVVAPYPNPVRDRATLEVAVRQAQTVTVALYNALGRRVATVHRGEVGANQSVPIRVRTSGLASGAYFVRIQGERFATTERITVIR
jgi:hypothetical protein